MKAEDFGQSTDNLKHIVENKALKKYCYKLRFMMKRKTNLQEWEQMCNLCRELCWPKRAN